MTGGRGGSICLVVGVADSSTRGVAGIVWGYDYGCDCGCNCGCDWRCGWGCNWSVLTGVVIACKITGVASMVNGARRGVAVNMVKDVS